MRAVIVKRALELARICLEEIAELTTHPNSDPRIHELANRALAQIQEILK